MVTTEQKAARQAEERQRFEARRRERQEVFAAFGPELEAARARYAGVVERLRRDGFAVMPGAVDRQLLEGIRKVMALYGPGRIVPLVGSVGDVLFADTGGVHCGAKPVSRDRWAMFLNYVLEEEYEGRGKKARIAQADLLKLTPKQRAAAEFLEVERAKEAAERA